MGDEQRSHPSWKESFSYRLWVVLSILGLGLLIGWLIWLNLQPKIDRCAERTSNLLEYGMCIQENAQESRGMYR